MRGRIPERCFYCQEIKYTLDNRCYCSTFNGLHRFCSRCYKYGINCDFIIRAEKEKKQRLLERIFFIKISNKHNVPKDIRQVVLKNHLPIPYQHTGVRNYTPSFDYVMRPGRNTCSLIAEFIIVWMKPIIIAFTLHYIICKCMFFFLKKKL